MEEKWQTAPHAEQTLSEKEQDLNAAAETLPQEANVPVQTVPAQEQEVSSVGDIPQADSSGPQTQQSAAAEQGAPTADVSPCTAENEAELLASDEAKQIIENLLFITDRPLKPSRIAEVVESVNAKRVLEIINELAREYADTGRAIRILEIGGGYQMCTKPEYGRWVRRLYNEKMTTRLSNAALETLAIIAYKQPVTRAEMEMIRGVDVAAPLERLLERGLVRVLGKRDTIGRPMVYGTTDEFLRLFGLNKISELPDLQVFAAKQVQEKQEDLPFEEKLPPLGEPAILALEEETGDAADAFFKRPKNMFDSEDMSENPDKAEMAADEPNAQSEGKEGTESLAVPSLQQASEPHQEPPNTSAQQPLVQDLKEEEQA